MNKVDVVKGFLSAVFGVLTSLFGSLALPIILLVGCNVIDYITGIGASFYRGQEISSYKGIRGITKKVCMWLLIVVGVIVDELIVYAVAHLGLAIPVTFVVACVVALWLICNELISILENLKDMGVPLPNFLVKLTQNIKSQIETKADVIKDTEEQQNGN